MQPVACFAQETTVHLMLWLGCFSIETLPKKYFEIKRFHILSLPEKIKKCAQKTIKIKSIKRHNCQKYNSAYANTNDLLAISIFCKRNIFEKRSFFNPGEGAFLIYDSCFLKTSNIFFSSLDIFTCVSPSISAVFCWEYSRRYRSVTIFLHKGGSEDIA